MSAKLPKDQGCVSHQALLDKNRALEAEVQDLKIRLEEAEELRRAISEGDLDALIIRGPKEELVFTLDSADRAYRVLVETMNEGTATLASDGTILYCNRQFAELTKMPPRTVVGKSIYGFIAPEDAITFKALLKQQTSVGEIKLRARDSTSVPVYLSISPLQSEGSPNAWCLVVTDLTEQKKNEEIVAAERLARSIIEQAAEAIVVCDTSGRITHFSNAMSKICRCDPTFQIFENLIDVRFSEGEDAGKSILPVSSALKGFFILGVEATFEREDCYKFHQKYHLLLNSGPLKNADGKIIGCVVTFADITERKLNEEGLRYHANLVDNVSDAIISTDKELKIQSWNKAAERIYGWQEDEVIGMEGSDVLQTTFPEGLSREAIAKDIFEKGGWEGELVQRTKDGRDITVHAKSMVLKDEAGVLIGGVSIIHDITERKREEQKILRYNSILEGINRISSSVVQAKTEEELGNACLSVALEVTGSQFGFINEMEADGLQHEIAISEGGWDQCLMYGKTGHRRPLGDFVMRSLYRRVIDNGKGFFTNDPPSHPDSIGLPYGHPPITSFLGVPLVQDGKTVGLIAVANREGDYGCEQQEDLETIASAAMQALHRKRSEESLRKAYEQIQTQSEELRTSNEELKTQSEELKEANEALYESEKRFRTLAENSPDIIVRVDRQKRNIYANPAVTEPYGRSQEEIVGKTNGELGMDPELVKFWERFYENVFTTGKTETLEFQYISSQGKEYYFNTKIVPEFVDGKVASILAISRDIKDIKEAEAKLKETLDNLENLVKERTIELEKAYDSLKESERGLAEAQKMAHLGSWYREIVTDKIYWSDEIYRIFGFKPQEFEVTYNAFLSYVHPEDRGYVNSNFKKALNGEPYSSDYRVISANGIERIVHEQGEVVFDEKKTPIGMRGTVQDITERKRAEEALEKMDKIRIKEIHHRIKNNLQVICSLLSLEAERFSDEKILEAFKESQNRVTSMALIHEELYRGKKSDALDFAAYLHKFTKDLFSSYNLGNNNTSLKTNLEQVYLDMDAAVPLGIIVNELISNSMKHAFPAGSEGEIHISLLKTETFDARDNMSSPDQDCREKGNFQYILKVMDNGKGIPEEIEIENADSLGLQLVNILVEQIGGCIKLKRNCGTEFAIWFGNTEK